MTRKLHVTEVGLFNQCERRYYYEKILGEEPEPNHYVLVGSAYHRAITTCFPDGAELCGQFKEAALRSVNESYDALSEVGVNPITLIAEIAQRLEELRVLLPASLKPSFVERQFSTKGWEGTVDWAGPNYVLGDERVKGQRPSWGEGLGVLDWKTIHGSRRRSIRDARLSPQLAMYTLNVPGARHAAFVEIPRDLKEPFVFLPVHYTEDELVKWRIWFDGIRKSVMRRKSKESYKMCKRDEPLCSAIWCPHYLTKCYRNESPDVQPSA